MSPDLSIHEVRKVEIQAHTGTSAPGWHAIICRDANGKALFEITIWGERGDRTPPILEVL